MTRGGPRDKTPKTPMLERGFLYQLADTLLVETCAAGKDIFYHLCGSRQDNKVVGTEIQMGPFVWVNKEGSLHDRPILTFLPALVPHEHTFNPSLRCTLCVCVCCACELLCASLAYPLHMAESWLTGKQPFFLSN